MAYFLNLKCNYLNYLHLPSLHSMTDMVSSEQSQDAMSTVTEKD